MVSGRLSRYAGLLLALLVALSGLLVDVGGSAAASKPASVDAAARLAGSRGADGLVPVIIMRSQDGAAVQAVKRRGGTTSRTLKLGKALVARVPVGSLDALAREPGVTRIAYDAPVRSTAQPDRDNRPLETVYPLAVEAAGVWSAGHQGQGVGVAILDSGIDQHVDYGSVDNTGKPAGRSRLVGRFAAALNDAGAAGDDYGHGTWVAGIVGGNGFGNWDAKTAGNGKYVGVAPGANLVGVKVSNRNGISRVSDVVAGIEWVVDNKARYNIKVLNLSLAQAVPESYRTSLLNAAVELAWFKGIVVVVSAGNLGPNSAFFPPANDPYAIVVGATDDHGTASTADDNLVWFSSHGRTQDGHTKPDLVAPGRRIVATLNSSRSALARQFPDRVTRGHYIRMSGTSAAAPVVSGVAALLLQARPDLRPDQVKWLLRHTARAVPGAGTGAGYPRAAAAIAFRGQVERANLGLKPSYFLRSAAQTGTRFGESGWEESGWEESGWEESGWEESGWEESGWEESGWESSRWSESGWEANRLEAILGD